MINYKEYIEYLKNQGYTRDQLNIDENSEIVIAKSLSKGSIGTVIDIRCPCRHKILIAGRETQKDFQAHALSVRFADKENIEISPYSRIRILKEKLSYTITVISTMLYKDLTRTRYLKIPPDDIKPYEEFYKFDENLELNGEEHLKIDIINPDIDIDVKNVKLLLDMDLMEEE